MKHVDDRLRRRVRSAGASSTTWCGERLRSSHWLPRLRVTPGSRPTTCAPTTMPAGLFSCAHEQMFDEAMRFYTELVPSNRFSQEIIAHAADIRAGVGAPDAGDPSTTTPVSATRWSPSALLAADQSIGKPQVQVLDPYQNAFNAAQGLWTRALGEYAAGNTAEAYKFLGMIAHFLGDQTVPAHAHGDTHPENFNDGNPFEEWMSNPLLNKTLLTDDEFSGLVAQGLVDLPDYENIDKLLWLFLNVNQVGGYFGSDDNDGDANLNRTRAIRTRTTTRPTPSTRSSLPAPRTGPVRPMRMTSRTTTRTPIRTTTTTTATSTASGKYSYVPGVRRLAALLSLWEQAIQQPIMTLTVHDMQETGFNGAAVCFGGTLGLDDCGQPDYYLGVVMGDRKRSPVPPGALLESDDDDHSYR